VTEAIRRHGKRPLRLAHIIYRLDFGGMENGLVNLINALPGKEFSHTIICLTYATEFRARIRSADVEIVELHKPAGNSLSIYRDVYRTLRRIRPDIVHTRNLGTVDFSFIAYLAFCPIRIHGEHGWDASDLHGNLKKYRVLRRLCNFFIHRYVAVSRDIGAWLINVIGIDEDKIVQIYNGVDTERFTNAGKVVDSSGPRIVFGTLGRQDSIKGLDVLIEALCQLRASRPELVPTVRVVLAGDGPNHERYKTMIEETGLSNMVEMPGPVEDVPELLRSYDFFVQPSHNEGISNTVLEAMATGLPVIATSVGGNPELIRDGEEGLLVDRGDAGALCACLEKYIDDSALRTAHGLAARERVERRFGLDVMIGEYSELYARLASGSALTAGI